MENTKKNIADLVEKYNRLKKENKIKDYSEAQTVSEFIEPLFNYLGWDIHNLRNEKEVTPEENISGNRVDRAFRLNGIVRFFLEAKSMKADLDVESYARQAIKYSWNKGVTYAVLTDFEEIKVFNANAKSNSLRDKIIFQVSCENYISDFEKLWLLSKESFEKGSLDEYAESIFKKSQKLTVNEKLYDDLKKAREILTDSFKRWDIENKLDQEGLDEGVQRILDRLVFIRVLEDRGLEDLILRSLTRDEKNNQEIFHSLIGKFRELDKIYNSNLFQEHACENWENYDLDDFKKVIELLYGNDAYEYDFKEIPADILGGVYESYLGYIAQNPINVGHKKGKLFELDSRSEIKTKSRQKRKEHGIYYTPKFIVDYIVKNTLGEKLKEINNINELKKIKVLDPACGSGSFLTRALEEINAKYKDFGDRGNQYTKTGIILSNIFGVDLDSQAVELAKLNLLIDTLEKKNKLPDITNVKTGNSLISGTETELEKYFGKKWRDKKPFNWKEEFPEVFSQGGFDVIIGNPPYVRPHHIDKETKKYLWSKSPVIEAKSDLYAAFIERGLFLLKNKGLFSYIVPHTWLGLESFKSLRKLIFSKYRVSKIIITPKKTFASAQVETIIFVIERSIADENHKIGIYEIDNLGNLYLIGSKKQSVYKDGKVFDLSIGKNINLLSKIELNREKLSNLVNFFYGIKTGDDNKFLTKKPANNNEYKKLLRRSNFDRYRIKFNGEYVYYRPDLMRKNKLTARPGEPNRFEEEKIIIMDIAKKLVCTLDKEGYYIKDALILKKKNIGLRFLAAIINSKLLNYYYLQKYKVLSVAKNAFLDLPIPKINFSNYKEKAKHDGLANLVDKMLELNKNLQSTAENSDKWNSIKKEIEKTGKEIDQEVYKLYRLTEDEIKIVESNNLK